MAEVSACSSSRKRLAGLVELDTGDVSWIPDFIKKLTIEHPVVDCLVNNEGVQRPLDVNKMDISE